MDKGPQGTPRRKEEGEVYSLLKNEAREVKNFNLLKNEAPVKRRRNNLFGEGRDNVWVKNPSMITKSLPYIT